MSYITPLHGSPAVSWTTNIHPSILWHFVKYNLYQIRCDYPVRDQVKFILKLENRAIKNKGQGFFPNSWLISTEVLVGYARTWFRSFLSEAFPL